MLETLINDANERAVHEGLVHSIAHEIGMSEKSIEEIYARELVKLKENARILEFLPLLVARRVRDTLRDNRHH